jgi:hypothetical protein
MAWTRSLMSGAGGMNHCESRPSAPDPSGTAGDVFLGPELEDSRQYPFGGLAKADLNMCTYIQEGDDIYSYLCLDSASVSL